MADELKRLEEFISRQGMSIGMRNDLRALIQLVKDQREMLSRINVTGPCPHCCYPYVGGEYDPKWHEKWCQYASVMNRYAEMGGE